MDPYLSLITKRSQDKMVAAWEEKRRARKIFLFVSVFNKIEKEWHVFLLMGMIQYRRKNDDSGNKSI